MTLGEAATQILNPPAKFLCRALPSSRPLLWNNLIAPKLCWRDYPFTAESEFGASFIGNTNDLIQRYIYYFGTWEPFVGQFIKRRLQPGDVALDIGANVGYMSLLAAAAVGPTGRVIAIEAASKTYESLRANLAQNPRANVTTIHGAVTNQHGTIELFHEPPDSLGSGLASTAKDFGAGSEKVEAGPIEHWVSPEDLARLRLIKIDVEGAELQVLESVAGLLGTLPRNVEIVCELSFDLCDRDAISATLARFTEAGFYFYRLPEDRIEHYVTPRPSVADRWYNLGGDAGRIELVLSRQEGVSI